jgi:hypothetical protein
LCSRSDGGEYTVSLSETIASSFGAVTDIPSLTVAASVYIDPVPYHLVIMQNETENMGSYSTFHYQLRNKEGQKLTGAYGVKEHMWKDRAATQHMQLAHNSENVFEPQQPNGEYYDNAGYDSYTHALRGGSVNVYQTFSVLYYGGTLDISTEFEHITSVVASGVSNSVIDIKP